MISFHHKIGLRISNATTIHDDNVFFPLRDDTHPLAVASRHPDNIHFDHVKVVLDFDSLVDVKD